MKKNRNTDSPYNTDPENDFMFPDSGLEDIDDVRFSFPLDEGYDGEDEDYDGEEDSGYDTYDENPGDYDGNPGVYDEVYEDGYDEGEYEDDSEPDLSSMSKKERKAYEKYLEKQEKKQEKKAAKRGKNREILLVMYSFIFLFVAMIGYFVYFNAAGYKDIISHPGNIHIARLQEKNTRGRILASDGSVLAQTQVDYEGNEIRVYPYANVFAHVVGTSSVNKSGIEAAYESSMLLSNANGLGKVVNELKNEKNPGDDVVTTLDLYLQQVAYSALGNQQGAVVAIEPGTGKVLAMVSKPDYDPNTLAQNYEAIVSDPESKVLLNQATSGLFTPGSIFKLCTTLEYIRENPDYENYTYTCYGNIELSDGNGGQALLSCYHGNVHGTQTLAQSFANSCNSSYANIGTTLNASGFGELCDTLLFNQTLPTSIPHVKSIFTVNTSKNDWLTGATAIGQGNTVMTPLHAAMLASAVANGGVLMEPYLVDSIQNVDGKIVKKYMPNSYGSLMTAKEASILKDMMVQTVSYGTANALNYLGYTVAGKTGTAEVDNYGNNAWFIGFAPADNPKIAVCVLVENSEQSSSYVAVPIAQQLFYAYLNR